MSGGNKTKKVDPGWNDPPILNYSPTNPPPKSRIGNKRVAFPLTSSTTTPVVPVLAKETGKSPNVNVPPVTGHDSDATLKKVMQNVDAVLGKMGSSGDSTKAKIEIMRTMWTEDKLSEKIQKIVLSMSTHILEGNISKANECHLQLLMENSALCGSWVVGFGELITTTQQ